LDWHNDPVGLLSAGAVANQPLEKSFEFLQENVESIVTHAINIRLGLFRYLEGYDFYCCVVFFSRQVFWAERLQ
jgi:hypothetical protein